MEFNRAKSCIYFYLWAFSSSHLGVAAFHPNASFSSRIVSHNYRTYQSWPSTFMNSVTNEREHVRKSHSEGNKRSLSSLTTLCLSELCESDDSELFESIGQMPEQDKILDEIAWRSTKVRLEEANTRRFKKTLRSKPWKLPYDDARIWVQKNLGVDTKEEFFDLVANGNLRTPYIPKEPEKYYTDNGTWISWDHFLKG